MIFGFEIKCLSKIKIVKRSIKKYKRLPCQVLIRSNLLITKSFLSFLKVFVSLVIKFTNIFFSNIRQFSNLINIDLMKGYLGLRSSILFSMELIVCAEFRNTR